MSIITKFEIDMLNVGAADAILLHAFAKIKGKEWEYVVLVDAGNEGDGAKIINHINKYYEQKYIDLAICTHCDSDHYGGFKELIEEHKKQKAFSIRKFWVHDPYKHVNINDVKFVRTNPTLKQRLHDAYAFNDGSNLLDMIDKSGIPREEAFTGKKYIPLNIKVLGPDKDYYESLIPDFSDDLAFKTEEEDFDLETYNFSEEDKSEIYSQTLEEANDDPSKVNQSSIIFSFSAFNNTYLFTGDAGKDALHRVINIDYWNILKHIHWLKVPHHGSKHNLDNDIIEYFHPDISYISTEKYGKFVNRCTVNALKKVGNVYSTQDDNGSKWHHVKTDYREDYSSSQKL